MADEIVLSFHDSLLRESDLSLLEEGRWLNDRLIGFVFDYFTHNQFKQISNDVVFISPDVTQFLKLGQGIKGYYSPSSNSPKYYKKCIDNGIESGIEIGIFLEPLNLPNQKLVFFAVNDNDSKLSAGGSHWSLLMYNRQTNSFHHYDSCSTYNTSAARSLARNVEPFLHAKQSPSFVEGRCPQQENSYDCGIYVICIAEELCKNFLVNKETSLSDTVTAKNIRQKRNALKKLILDLGQTKT